MTVYVSDQAHSEVAFQVKHMMVSKVRGGFENFHFEIETEDLETFKDASLYAEIQTESINTKNTSRDEHLRSEDFFNAEKNPKITFQSKSISKSGETISATGDVTMNGVTKEKTIELEYNGKAMDPWGNEVHGIQSEFVINREEFGLTWNQKLETGGVMVGKEVKAMVELEFTEKTE
ncbi:YceI family protein [Salinicoccus jeotgali]|uniref:YceI family protein n=1 Tax=Salinicoccus jeotgali TaxID=381634 RepID=A0ABP7ESH1_9STAP